MPPSIPWTNLTAVTEQKLTGAHFYLTRRYFVICVPKSSKCILLPTSEFFNFDIVHLWISKIIRPTNFGLWKSRARRYRYFDFHFFFSFVCEFGANLIWLLFLILWIRLFICFYIKFELKIESYYIRKNASKIIGISAFFSYPVISWRIWRTSGHHVANSKREIFHW